MDIRRLPADEAAIRRYIEELWLPYNRELETVGDGFALADGVDIVAAELDHRLERHESESYRCWVAVDGGSEVEPLAESDGEFVGFVTTEIDDAPTVFDRPDRLVICDIYVREPYRGTGLATDLVDRARERAREAGCRELELEVDVGNDRAIAFYGTLGFEPSRHPMLAGVERE